MEKVQMTVEYKSYNTNGVDRSFGAIIFKVDGEKFMVERLIESPLSHVEKAIDKLGSDISVLEVSFTNTVLNEGEKEYLSDKFDVVFV